MIREESKTMGKTHLFNKWHWKNWLFEKKNQVNPHNFIPYTKINLSQTRNPILKMTLKKHFERKYGWVFSWSTNEKELARHEHIERNWEEKYWWFCPWKIVNYTSKCKQNLEYKWQAGEHIFNKPDREKTNTIPYEKQAKNVNTHFKKRRNGK